MWADEMTVLAGNGVTFGVGATQLYCNYCYQLAYANASSAGWNFQCEAGDYTFTVLYVKANVCGIIDFYIDGVAVDTGLDTYAAATAWNQTRAIAVTGLAAGRHTFKYVVNGKNAGSGNYAFYVTKVSFKQATD